MKKFDVTGMTCAACAAHVEKSVKSVDGVTNVNVSLLTNSMTVEYESPATDEKIIKAVEKGGYGASLPGEGKAAAPEEDRTLSMKKRLIISAALLAPLMYISLGGPLPAFMSGPVFSGLLQLFLAVPVIYVGRDYYISGFKALLHRAPNMSTLIALGSCAGLLQSIYCLFEAAYMADAHMHAGMEMMYHFEASAMILTLVTAGKYLESRAKDHTKDAISRLVELTPVTAEKLEGGEFITVEASSLKPGDVCRVRDGGRIPADGTILEGHGSIDMSMLTGESLPVECGKGASVAAATVNKEGVFTMRVDKVGEDTALSNIVRLVEAAASSKAPISRLADKVSGIFVPVVLGIAAVTAAVWIIVSHDVSRAIQMAVSVLVVSCPCALGLATPAAIMVATGKGAEMGIMIKSAASLEEASRITLAAFDKTGTLTRGRLTVDDVYTVGDADMERLAASAEALSVHPIAKAIRNRVKAPLYKAEDYISKPGRGISALVNGKKVTIGSEEFVSEEAGGVEGAEAWRDKKLAEGKIVMYVAVDGRFAGCFSLSDALSNSGLEGVRRLKELGVKTLMLTGDNERTAQTISALAGVDGYRAMLMPEDKALYIKELKASEKVMMTGDGINDAPALTEADIGVAVMRGTDVAIESADIVLARDDLTLVAGAVRLGRATMRNIKQNLFWACAYNALMIPIAAGVFASLGFTMSPILCALAMSISSLTVVSNALRLRRFTYEGCGADNTYEEDMEDIVMTRTVRIEGMMCMNCVKHVKKALEGIGLKADVSLEKNLAVVEGEASDDAIRAAVTDAGYEVTSIE